MRSRDSYKYRRASLRRLHSCRRVSTRTTRFHPTPALVAFDIEDFAQAFGHLSYKIGLAGSVRAEPVTLRSSLADLHGVCPQEQIIVVFFYRGENRQRMVVLLPFGVEAVCFDGQQRMTESLGYLHRTIAPIQRGEK